MDFLLPSYLSLNYDSKTEEEYILGLIGQFQKATESESYHLALFAYHLVFMVFVYQSLYKSKIWMPEKFSVAFISFSAEERREYRETNSPYAFSRMKERSVLELLNLFSNCEELVLKCKTMLVDYRNNSLGHANLYLVSQEEFDKKTSEYDSLAVEITALYLTELDKIIDAYAVQVTDGGIEFLSKDTVELELVIPNRLSFTDLILIRNYCKERQSSEYQKISEILENEFNVMEII